MNKAYENLIIDATKLLTTFTISYDVENHMNDVFSSTYDELSGWVRKALKEIEVSESGGKESDLYKYIRKFRGRAGDITRQEFLHIISELNQTH